MAGVKQGKLVHIEILRIMCIFLVMFNHTTPTGYLSFVGADNTVFYYLSMALSVFCKIAVPVFFMISGALLLGKEESIANLLKNRVLKMAIILFVVSIAYYVVLNFKDGISIRGFFRRIYTDAATTALWYLYSYIGFLLMLPVLRRLVRMMRLKEYKYIFFVHVSFSLITAFLDAAFLKAGSANPSLSFSMFLEFNIFFPLMGYYAENISVSASKPIKKIIIALIGMIVSIILTCLITQIYVLRNDLGTDYKAYESFFNCLIAVTAVSVYSFVKDTVKIDASSLLGKTVSQLGGAVFGVYLIEKILRMVLSPVYNILAPYIGSFFATIVWVFAGIIFGLVMVCLFRNIPLLGKYIRKWI